MGCECIYDVVQHDKVHDLILKIMDARFANLELPFLIEEFKVEQVIFRCIGSRHQKQDELLCELNLIYVVDQGTTSLLLKLLIQVTSIENFIFLRTIDYIKVAIAVNPACKTRSIVVAQRLNTLYRFGQSDSFFQFYT